MQITDAMAKTAWEVFRACIEQSLEDFPGHVWHGESWMRAALEAALGYKRGDAPEIIKALRSPVAETKCDCFRCRAADCIEELAGVTRRMMKDASFLAIDEARSTLEKWGLNDN